MVQTYPGGSVIPGKREPVMWAMNATSPRVMVQLPKSDELPKLRTAVLLLFSLLFLELGVKHGKYDQTILFLSALCHSNISTVSVLHCNDSKTMFRSDTNDEKLF